MLRLKLALLNVLRNGRRSIITLLAIQFGVISLIIFGGFVASMYDGMRENIIRSQLGHLQVYAEGFNQYGNQEPENYLIDGVTVNKAMEIIEGIQGVEIVTPRLNFAGLLSNGQRSLAVVGEGIDPDKEALLSSAVQIKEGEDLFPDDESGGLLGEGLYQALNAAQGDYLTLMSNTADGAINAVDVIATGAISTGTREIDSRLLRINISHAQNLIYTEGVTRLVILLDDTKQTEAVYAELQKQFKAQGLALEMRTWSELAEYYHEVVNLFNGVFDFVRLIVIVIVALSISNTMMMAVMERTPEIGTIRAIGGTRNEIISLFMAEAFYLGVIGSITGVVFGILMAQGITQAEFMMPTPPGSSQTYPIRVFVESKVLWETAALGVVIAVISSIYPAFKASRMVINQALRFA